MTRPALTPEQARAARAAGSVAVVAGAGTGKTHMLAYRYLHHLEGGLSPLQTVAVTFTEKAAAELRSRIRALARAEMPERGDVLAELEAAQISTIHALAARICRDHPEEAEVPPDFQVLEDLDSDIWIAERLEEALNELPAELVHRLPLATLEQVLPELLGDPLTAEAALGHGAERWRELLDAERAEAIEVVLDHPDWAAGIETLSRYRGAEGDKGEQARRDCLEAMAAFAEGNAALALECVKRFRTNAGSKKAWDEAELEAVRGALKAVKALITGACDEGLVLLEWGAADEALAALLPDLRSAFRQVRDSLARAKRQARALDFSDLEVHALRALEHEPVRRHCADRWKAFLVDEFQDTNPVQAQILERLAASHRDAGYAGATLTVVGDEKQAIYGFRGADVTVFRGYRERIRAEGGGEVVLESSFRTHAELMGRFNLAFRAVLGDDLHQDLRAERRPPCEPPFLTFHPLEAVKGSSRADRRTIEAHAIAAAARELVEAGTLVFDKGTGEPRPVRYGDIAVLARTWLPFDTYAEVLPALGVPAVHSGGGNLLDTREAKDGVALLRFLADPKDDVALVALLRSPFFALDDRTLHAVASGMAEGMSWWEAIGGEGAAASGEAAGSLPTTFDRPRLILGELLRRKRDTAPSRLLQLLDDATGYGAVLANLPGASRRVADWRGFGALVRELERGSQDVFAVARRLRRLLQAEVDVPRPTLHADDAVTLLTIHKAKGLEWPIVIVADLAADGGGRGPRVLVERDCGVALKLEDDDGESLEPALFTLLKARRKAREQDEARRLLYVALTRARDRVILTADKPDGGPLRLLFPGLEAAAVPVQAVAYDPSAAVYPDAPAPDLSGEGLLHEGVALWEVDARPAVDPPKPGLDEGF